MKYLIPTLLISMLGVSFAQASGCNPAVATGLVTLRVLDQSEDGHELIQQATQVLLQSKVGVSWGKSRKFIITVGRDSKVERTAFGWQATLENRSSDASEKREQVLMSTLAQQGIGDVDVTAVPGCH